MGLFSRRHPPLPSYAGVPLAARLADPVWSAPIASAGFDTATAELVMVVGAVSVSSPRLEAADGMPFVMADTGILIVAQGRVGIAVPDEARIVVVSYDNYGAELNVGNSGILKLVWAGQTEGIIFDDTNADTPQGRAFAETLLRFVRT